MSVDYTLILVVKQSSFVEEIRTLTAYEVSDQTGFHDPYYYLPNDSIAHFTSKVLKFTKEPYSSNIEIGGESLAKCLLIKGDQELTIYATPWMQNMYIVPDDMAVVALEFEMGTGMKDVEFIPTDHPIQPFLEEITETLRPLCGWLEGDFTGKPEPHTSIFAAETKVPWQIASSTQIVGPPLSKVVEQHPDFDQLVSNLYCFKRLEENIFWITQPGEWTNKTYIRDSEDPTYIRHMDAMQRLWEILLAIPSYPNGG